MAKEKQPQAMGIWITPIDGNGIRAMSLLHGAQPRGGEVERGGPVKLLPTRRGAPQRPTQAVRVGVQLG